MEETEKRYYKIGEVSRLIRVPESTIRYWETEFPECRPSRTMSGLRQYTPKNIETLRVLHYLLKVKGLRIEAAKSQLKMNPQTVSRQQQILENLVEVRDELKLLLDSMKKRK